MTWEYDIIELSLNDIQGAKRRLNRLGKDGWEVTGTFKRSGDAIYIYMLIKRLREIVNPSSRNLH